MVAAKKDAATGESLGTGRRKSAVARVRVKAGTKDPDFPDMPATDEEKKVRARYGTSNFGQSCLLARRLVEHGVRLRRPHQ